VTDRLNAITCLLNSLDWFDPQPETSTGNIVRRGSKPGEGPSMKVDCGVCKGEGEIRKRGMPAPCPNLGCRDGKVMVDAYTGRQVSTADAYVPEVRIVSCDTCGGERRINGRPCLPCRGSGVAQLTADQWRATHGLQPGRTLTADVDWGAGGDPVSAAIDKRDLLGSYWELGLALGALRLEMPRAYRLLVRLEVERTIELDALDQPRLLMRQTALAYLERLMPAEILVPPGVRIAERNRKARERIAKRQRENAA